MPDDTNLLTLARRAVSVLAEPPVVWRLLRVGVDGIHLGDDLRVIRAPGLFPHRYRVEYRMTPPGVAPLWHPNGPDRQCFRKTIGVAVAELARRAALRAMAPEEETQT